MTEKSSKAHENGVRTLYKFMSYPRDGAISNNAESRRRAEALLRDGEMYFATAHELNDPFEAAPHFRIPGTTPNEMLEAFSRPLRNVYAPAWDWNKEQILAEQKALAANIQSGEFQVRITNISQQLRESLKTEYPMCCLSATRDSTLMWSYYSGGHTGICVHFDATQAPFANAERVTYSQEFPTIHLPFAELNSNELVKLALFTKSCVWKHEKEYRLINFPMEQPPAISKRMLDDIFEWRTAQLAIIPPYVVVGVTIGASMRDSEIETILRICHDRSIQIPVFQAKCMQDKFDLEFVQIG